MLKDINNLKIFLGQLGSQIFEKIFSLGVLWILTKEYSENTLPWFIVLGSLPHLLFLNHAPQWVHRLGALKAVYVSDFFRGLLFVGSALIVPVLPPTSRLPFLFLLNFLSNAAGSLFNSAILTLPLQMTKGAHQQKLTALLSGCFTIGSVIGPLLAVVVYEKCGLAGLLLLNGMSFFLAGLLAMSMKIPSTSLSPSTLSPAETNNSILPQSGRVLLKEDQLLRKIFLNFLGCNLVLGPLMVMLPLFSKTIFAGSMSSYAVLEFSLGLGMIAGTLLLSIWELPGRTWYHIFMGIFMVGMSYFGFVLTKTLWPAALGLFILGFSLETVNIVVINLFQKRPQEKDVPVVMSMANFVGAAALPFSMLLVSLSLPLIGLKGLGLSCALMVLFFSLQTPFIPQIREI